MTVPHATPEQDGVGQTHMPPLQLSPALQLPHETVREFPQLSVAVKLPHSLLFAEQSAVSLCGVQQVFELVQT